MRSPAPLALLLAAAAAQPAFLSASSPLVLWGGRYAVNATDGSVAFDMEGTSASLVVTGQGATISMWCNSTTLGVNSSARFSVYVNDQDAGNLMVHRDTPTYLLAASLPSAVNNITVLYAFEPGSSGASRPLLRTPAIFGFSAGNGGAFAQPQPAARRIDILGDSISAGSMYDRLESVGGPLSLGTGCHPWSPVTSYSQAFNWETYLCRYFRANCTTVAWSGGVLVDPSVSHCPPRAYIPGLFTHTFATSAPGQEPWDFARATRPDAVIIYLGTNDFGCENMTDALYTAAALALVHNITAYYSASPGPAASHFILTIGPMSPSRPLAAITAAIAAATAEGMQASLLDMRNVTLDGCGSHPGPVGHWSMALEAAPQIKAIMGWD